MSARVEVTSPPRPESGSTTPLRVRPPRPWPQPRKTGLLIGVVVLVLVGALLVSQAQSADQGGVPGQQWWRGLQPPRAAVLDGFDQTGPLGVGEALDLSKTQSGWTRADGQLQSGTSGLQVATVPTPSSDVLAYAQVINAAPGSGVVIGEPGSATGGLVSVALVAREGGSGWQIVRTAGGTSTVLAELTGPVSNAAIQLVHRGDTATATVGNQQHTVNLPATDEIQPVAGVVARSSGTTIDLFGYLPLGNG